MAEKFLTYKGKPFVRSGNIIYYGDMADDFVVMLQVLASENVEGESVATKVAMQLMRTAEDVPAKDRLVKTSVKPGLYEAMDLASVWLTRALENPE
ncbi:MAG TPA: hypothetical protein VN446_09635 [Candidatus Acidoferrum sp.]|nr:hypothetical protein [Candidatus Acidoferrum sp.]